MHFQSCPWYFELIIEGGWEMERWWWQYCRCTRPCHFLEVWNVSRKNVPVTAANNNNSAITQYLNLPHWETTKKRHF